MAKNKEKSVYVFEVGNLNMRTHSDGEPLGEMFATTREAVAWIIRQPFKKRFVILRVLADGSEGT